MSELVQSPDNRLSTVDLLPPEIYYRPRRHSHSLAFWAAAVLILFTAPVLAALLGISPALFAIVVGISVVGFAGYRVADIYRAANENYRGSRLLVSGEVDEAAEIFESLAKKHRSHPHHALFVHNRGVAFMMEGQHRRAFSLFNAVTRSKRFHSRALKSFRYFPERHMALSLALIGELSSAERFMAEAENRAGASDIGYLVLPRSIILLRTGRPEAALRWLVEHWKKAEGLANGQAIKTLRVVRAFARASVDGPDHPEVRRMIDGTYPAEPSDFQWLCVEWPRMRQFCTEHGLL